MSHYWRYGQHEAHQLRWAYSNGGVHAQWQPPPALGTHNGTWLQHPCPPILVLACELRSHVSLWAQHHHSSGQSTPLASVQTCGCQCITDLILSRSDTDLPSNVRPGPSQVDL